MVLLLNEALGLVTKGTEIVEVLNVVFASASASKTSIQKSQTPETRTSLEQRRLNLSREAPG